MKSFFYILLFTAVLTCTNAYEHRTIDTVLSYHWGEGQNAGQDEKYFPANIFGCPDTAARENLPASSAEDVCSLGLGGEIVVGFKGYEIVDGPGADFTIFENAFLNPVTNKVFVEPARISVSYDGINFVDFPFDTLTLKGCAGITPTNGDKDCFNSAESGGDSFDLAALGLQKIRYIKIKDISKILLDNPEHPYYDPIISGFDLDAVCGLNLQKAETSADIETKKKTVSIIAANGTLTINVNKHNAEVKIFDISGREIKRCFVKENNCSERLNSGLYFVFVFSDGELIYKTKVVL